MKSVNQINKKDARESERTYVRERMRASFFEKCLHRELPRPAARERPLFTDDGSRIDPIEKM